MLVGSNGMHWHHRCINNDYYSTILHSDSLRSIILYDTLQSADTVPLQGAYNTLGESNNVCSMR